MNKDFYLVYVCSRRKHELFNYILNDFPTLSQSMMCVGTSVEAMKAVGSKYAEDKHIIVLTSNIFHGNNELGADKKPECEMTGAKLAALIKEKNPTAEIYLLSEYLSDDPIFNGGFKRDTVNGVPSKELRDFLEKLEKKHIAA